MKIVLWSHETYHYAWNFSFCIRTPFLYGNSFYTGDR